MSLSASPTLKMKLLFLMVVIDRSLLLDDWALGHDCVLLML
jgi:hypothetical protein